MAKTTKQSGLFDKYKDKIAKAHDEHKGDETNYGSGGDLPAGIDGGVARLVDCRFGQYKSGTNEGEYFFIAAGVVVSPDKLNGVKIAGLRTQIMEPICDTPTRGRKKVGDHVAWVLNEFRKLGVDTEDIQPAQYEQVAAGLMKTKPYFRFRTWSGSKQELEIKDGVFMVGNKKYKSEQAAKTANPFLGQEPRVNHDWRGLTEAPDDTPTEGEELVDATGEEGAEVEEQGALEEPIEGDGNLGALADAGNTDAAQKIQDAALARGIEQDVIDNAASWTDVAALVYATEEEEEAAEEGEEADDLEALGEAANDDDEVAQEKLAVLAAAAGLDPDDYDTWPALAEALGEGSGGDGKETVVGTDEPIPEVGDVMGYKMRLKSGGLSKTVKEIEVTVVHANGKFNVRDLDTSKVIKSVERDQLSDL